MSKLWLRCSLALSLTFVGGCRAVGPETIVGDRFDYSGAISDSWKRQTLLNIVKLRYFDPPTFMEVGQVVAGYSMETGSTATGQLTTSSYIPGNTLNQGRAI